MAPSREANGGETTDEAAALRAWAESVLAVLSPAVGERDALAVDGKILQGSRQQGASAVHLRSVLSHRWGLTLGQQAVADKTNEISGLEDVLRGLVVEGRVITVDALLTSRTIADRMGQGGGDDGMLGKGNQPPLPHEMPRVFHEAHLLAETMTATETVDSGHGRLEPRQLTASSALVG